MTLLTYWYDVGWMQAGRFLWRERVEFDLEMARRQARTCYLAEPPPASGRSAYLGGFLARVLAEHGTAAWRAK